ncbi:hypothetical protein JCGZ_08843 [Jatropha curcas]|uniref:TIR domain-containing protein n=1 Tax=Jatropha curcas TaxID=180498 RepID=A0A067KWL4_JATCU|nr:hypothetical protein JCGZ_08843 [Jatropha curcas]
MASSSSVHPPLKHDVFLSFSGLGTRNNFTSHLYAALRRQGIITFIDNRLDKGEEIEPIILKAIEDSYISVIIFSENFATSPWCSDELVKILECKKKWGQKILPVFYHVDPADVETQTESFGEAFAGHQKNFRSDISKVEKWSEEAAYLPGLVCTNTWLESAIIEEIIKDILKMLRHFESSNNSEDLVGVESKLQVINSLLCTGLDDILIIGIWGMAGIEGLEFLPDELRYMEWHFYPLKSLPSNFHPEMLVEHNLYGSSNLKVIILSHCKHLIKMLNFSKAQKLEIIDCWDCVSLKEVSPSISLLNNLYRLDLGHCVKIRNLPNVQDHFNFSPLTVVQKSTTFLKFQIL